MAVVALACREVEGPAAGTAGTPRDRGMYEYRVELDGAATRVYKGDRSEFRVYDYSHAPSEDLGLAVTIGDSLTLFQFIPPGERWPSPGTYPAANGTRGGTTWVAAFVLNRPPNTEPDIEASVVTFTEVTPQRISGRFSLELVRTDLGDLVRVGRVGGEFRAVPRR